MITILQIYILISIALLAISSLADTTDNYIGAKKWYRAQKERYKLLRLIDKTSPLHPLRWLIKQMITYPRTSLMVLSLVGFHLMLHLVNPYASFTVFKSPYHTSVDNQGTIHYQQIYRPIVLADPLSDLLGYYRSGFLIAQNTFFGGQPINMDTENEIIKEIHKRRFDPKKPYLISGDQFSVLYPRNLGVFYNQLLDPNTAHSKEDWENRQRIYLQSVLFAVDGLSIGDKPKTTLVPIAPRVVASTTVHPGDIGSDAVYGTLFAIKKMMSNDVSDDGRFKIMTRISAERLLVEKHTKLEHMVKSYIKAVVSPETGLVRSDIHLSSARDGVSRKSSFYDNVVLWSTLSMADELGILEASDEELNKMATLIKKNYWNENLGYYKNDAYDDTFSSDWLIGYVAGFFDLNDKTDQTRTESTIDYINENGLADPLPIKYQIGKPNDTPWAIKTFAPNYGGEAIWSYWGAEYITLLAAISEKSQHQQSYLEQAEKFISSYDTAIVRDGGFAETFNTEGQFLQAGFYKSIRITGWVVQFEHAKYQFDKVSKNLMIN